MTAAVVSLVVICVVVAITIAGCGGDEKLEGGIVTVSPSATAEAPTEATPQPKLAGKDCAEIEALDGTPERQPPSDFEVLSYARLYRSDGTKRFYAVLDGTPAELAARRDDAQNELVQNWGFTLRGTDQRDGVEATGHLVGAEHTVDVQVTPLCDGKIGIRYTVR